MSDYISNELQGDLPDWPDWMDDVIEYWDDGDAWFPDWVGVEDDAAQGR